MTNDGADEPIGVDADDSDRRDASDSDPARVSNQPDERSAGLDEMSDRDVEVLRWWTEPAAVLTALGCVLVAIGAFSTWSSGDGVSLNGTQGSQNGWLAVLYVILAASVIRALARGSAAAIGAVLLASVVTLLVVIGNETVPGFTRGPGYWASFVGGVLLAAAASTGIARIEPRTLDRRLWRPSVGGVLVVIAAVLFVVIGRVFAISEKPSWPPPEHAITADEAAAAAVEFARRDPRPDDVGIDYAWSTAATIEPWAEGTSFYPRIFADIEAARTSVHILMFGWKPGEVGDALTEILVERLDAGVEVRIVVDGVGSRPIGSSKAMYDRLIDAGAEIVVNDTTPVDRDGRLPSRRFDWSQDEVGRADHRKLYVIDGMIAWTGGAGIEDHFADGRFYDVMVRVTGDIVRQSQAVFFNAFVSHGAEMPDQTDRYFPPPVDPGTIPAAIVQVVPGGFVAATQAARDLIDGADERLDIMNPYLTDHGIIERVMRAAERGVDVRIVLSEESNNGLAAAATRHRYGDLIDAGVEIWEYPGAVVHAKLIVADDRVQFGTLNFDAWALYRNFEFAMVADSGATATKLEERVFEPTIDRSTRARPPTGMGVVGSWLSDKLTYFL